MSNSKILFSIIIPTYNRREIISKCLYSVLNQTHQNFEIIIVDNGSSDKTKQFILKNFTDERINYIYQTGSGTPASPRNTGIKNAKYEWICFLDSDDYWDKDKLLLIAKEVTKNNKIDVLCHNEKIYYSNKNKFGKTMSYGPYENDFYIKMLLYGNRMSTSAVTIRKSFLNTHDLHFNESKNLITVEDFDLWLRVARAGAYFKFIKKVLGYYVINNDENLISNKQLYLKSLDNLIRKHKNFLSEKNNKNQAYFKKIDLRFKFLKLKYLKQSNFNFFINFLKLFLKNPYYTLIILIKQIKK